MRAPCVERLIMLNIIEKRRIKLASTNPSKKHVADRTLSLVKVDCAPALYLVVAIDHDDVTDSFPESLAAMDIETLSAPDDVFRNTICVINDGEVLPAGMFSHIRTIVVDRDFDWEKELSASPRGRNWLEMFPEPVKGESPWISLGINPPANVPLDLWIDDGENGARIGDIIWNDQKGRFCHLETGEEADWDGNATHWMRKPAPPYSRDS